MPQSTGDAKGSVSTRAAEYSGREKREIEMSGLGCGGEECWDSGEELDDGFRQR